jgi:hypothetical protein
MSGLSIASDESTLTDDKLTSVRAFLDNEVSIKKDIRRARALPVLAG